MTFTSEELRARREARQPERPARRHIPKSVRAEVLGRFAGCCGYCGDESKRLQVDHMEPYERGGTDEPANLMPACPGCNNYKMNFDVEGFRRELARQVERARKYSLNFRLAEKFGLVTAHEMAVTFYFERSPSRNRP